jgi:hypothetical protein
MATSLNEIRSLTVLVLLGRSGRHDDDHRPFANAAQLLEDTATVCRHEKIPHR